MIERIMAARVALHVSKGDNGMHRPEALAITTPLPTKKAAWALTPGGLPQTTVCLIPHLTSF